MKKLIIFLLFSIKSFATFTISASQVTVTANNTSAGLITFANANGIQTYQIGSGTSQRTVINLANRAFVINAGVTFTHDGLLHEIDTASSISGSGTYILNAFQIIEGLTVPSRDVCIRLVTKTADHFTTPLLDLRNLTMTCTGGGIETSSPIYAHKGSFTDVYFTVNQTNNASFPLMLTRAETVLIRPTMINLRAWTGNNTLVTAPFNVPNVFIGAKINAPSIFVIDMSTTIQTVEDVDVQGSQTTYCIRGGRANLLNATKIPDLFSGDNSLSTTTFGGLCSSARSTKSLNFVIKNQGVNLENATIYMPDYNNGLRFTPAGESESMTVNKPLFSVTNISGTNPATMTKLVAFQYPLTTGVRLDMRDKNNSQTNPTQDVFVGGYEILPNNRNIGLLGQRTLTTEIDNLPDTSVTLSRANALTLLSSAITINTATNLITVNQAITLDQLYDCLKVYKYNGTQANMLYPSVSTLLGTAVGSILDLGTLNITNIHLLSNGVKFTSLKSNGTITNAGVINGLTINGNVIQTVPTNLISTIITGTLIYSQGTPITVNFTNCTIGTVQNNGVGLVTINPIGTTSIATYTDAEINYLDSFVTFSNTTAGTQVVMKNVATALALQAQVIATSNIMRFKRSTYSSVTNVYFELQNATGVAIYSKASTPLALSIGNLGNINFTLPVDASTITDIMTATVGQQVWNYSGDRTTTGQMSATDLNDKLNVINTGVQKASVSIPHTDNIPNN